MQELCKYCKEPLKKVDCLKFDRNSCEFSFKSIACELSIHKAISIILYIISIFYKAYRVKYMNFRYKKVCANKNCLAYLDGCFISKNRL